MIQRSLSELKNDKMKFSTDVFDGKYSNNLRSSWWFTYIQRAY